MGYPHRCGQTARTNQDATDPSSHHKPFPPETITVNRQPYKFYASVIQATLSSLCFITYNYGMEVLWAGFLCMTKTVTFSPGEPFV